MPTPIPDLIPEPTSVPTPAATSASTATAAVTPGLVSTAPSATAPAPSAVLSSGAPRSPRPAPPARPTLRTFGSIVFLTGPCTAIRRNLEPRPRARIAVHLPRLAALLNRPPTTSWRWPLPLSLPATPRART